MGPRGDWEPGDGGYSLRLPSYESTFRAFSLVGRRWPRRSRGATPTRDAAAVLGAIRAGRVTTVIDALAGPARLASSAIARRRRDADGRGGRPGVDAVADGDACRRRRRRAELRLLKDGVVVERSTAGSVCIRACRAVTPAVYRVEVALARRAGHAAGAVDCRQPDPRRLRAAPCRRAAAAAGAVGPAGAAWSGWRVEQHPASVTQLTSTVLTPTNTAWTLTWRLGGGAPAGQYAAIAVPVPPDFLRGADRVSFTVRSAAPMRVSVQVRDLSERGARWQRSVYAVAVAAPSISVAAARVDAGRRAAGDAARPRRGRRDPVRRRHGQHGAGIGRARCGSRSCGGEELTR